MSLHLHSDRSSSLFSDHNGCPDMHIPRPTALRYLLHRRLRWNNGDWPAYAFYSLEIPAQSPHTHTPALPEHSYSSGYSLRSPSLPSSLWTVGIHGLHPHQYTETQLPFSSAFLPSVAGMSVYAVYSWRSVCSPRLSGLFLPLLSGMKSEPPPPTVSLQRLLSAVHGFLSLWSDPADKLFLWSVYSGTMSFQSKQSQDMLSAFSHRSLLLPRTASFLHYHGASGCSLLMSLLWDPAPVQSPHRGFHKQRMPYP